jgi:hypothetical protein
MLYGDLFLRIDMALQGYRFKKNAIKKKKYPHSAFVWSKISLLSGLLSRIL